MGDPKIDFVVPRALRLALLVLALALTGPVSGGLAGPSSSTEVGPPLLNDDLSRDYDGDISVSLDATPGSSGSIRSYDQSPEPSQSRTAVERRAPAAKAEREAASALPRIAGGSHGAMFDEAGIEMGEHFLRRLGQRASRLSESDALDAYRNGRLFYDPKHGSYVRYSSRTRVAVATDAPTGGKALSVFEGNPAARWNPVRWRPGQ